LTDHAKERQIPLVLIGLGLALYVVAAFVRTGPQGVGPTLLAVLLGGVAQTAILVAAAFLLATVIGISFGEVGPAVLKFAAAALVGGAVSALIPYGGIVAIFVFLGLIMWLFELEVPYAVALTILYLVVSFAVAFVIRAALA
jgi:hypothetical protein